MRNFYLIGYPLTHSFSAAYFKSKFERENLSDAFYFNFPLSSLAAFRAWALGNRQLVGLNVTLPYKEKIMPFLDQVDPLAGQIGAVNTIKKIGNKLIGYNTDALGFKSSLPVEPIPHKRALILGTGGASKAVKYVFDEMGIDVLLVSRKPKQANEIDYKALSADLLSEVQYLVNTTPLGTFPQTDSAPDIPYTLLNASHVCYDLVYNPEETVFMQKAKAQGATTCNGLHMLKQQAEAAWRIWNA